MEINKDEVGIIAGIFAMLVTFGGWLWKGRGMFGKVEKHDEEIEAIQVDLKDLKKEFGGIRNAVTVLTEQVKGIDQTTDLKLERLNDSIRNMGQQFMQYHDINNDTLKALHLSHENNNSEVRLLAQSVVRIESAIKEMRKS